MLKHALLDAQVVLPSKPKPVVPKGPRKCMIIPKKAPGKFLHIAGGRTGNGTIIHVWDQVAHKHEPNQEFLWDGKLIRSAKAPGKCLHLDNGKTGDGTRVHL